MCPTLDRDKKGEHLIKKKTHKLIVLKFLVRRVVNLFCELNLCLINTMSLSRISLERFIISLGLTSIFFFFHKKLNNCYKYRGKIILSS